MGGEKVRTEKPEEPCSQQDKISLFPPQPTKQQPLVLEGSSPWLGTVLKLLPISNGNQLAGVGQRCLNKDALHVQGKGSNSAPCSHMSAIFMFQPSFLGKGTFCLGSGKVLQTASVLGWYSVFSSTVQSPVLTAEWEIC